jgi:hypothetical protein
MRVIFPILAAGLIISAIGFARQEITGVVHGSTD